MSSVKVLGFWFSPFVARVKMALQMKGVDYEYIEEDIGNKSDLLLRSNPIHKKVPVLLHNGKAIVETMIILEYIDQTWQGPPILPQDPYQRATARFWVNFIEGKFLEAMLKARRCSEEEREKLKEEAREALNFLENEIRGKKYFGGDEISVIDHAANIIAYWIPITSVSLQLLNKQNFPNLCRWGHDYCNHSLVKEHLPPMDLMLLRFGPK